MTFIPIENLKEIKKIETSDNKSTYTFYDNLIIVNFSESSS